MLLHDYLHFHAREYPDHPFAEFEGNTLSYAEAESWANRFANSLLASGLGKGDRFSWISMNCVEICLMFFAASKVGIIPVPLNYRLAPREWAYIIKDSGSRALFCQSDLTGAIDTVRDELDDIESFIALPGPQTSATWQDLQSWMGDDESRPIVAIDPAEQCYQMYTSGTTGLPKGAMLSYSNVSNNIHMAAISAAVGIRAERNLMVAPIYHAAAALTMMCMVACGCTLVIQREFNPVAVVDCMESDGITMITMVPAMIQACLVHVPDIGERRFPSLRLISYGASPIARETLQQAMEVFGCGFSQGFGMTELTCVATTMTPVVHDRAVSSSPGLLLSAGRAQVGTEMKIVDDDDQEVPPGTVGEILIRGPQVMMGYWNMPEPSEKTLKGGWMHTGDAGYMDEEGFVYIQDRIKDMIVSGGENIYPAEIEKALFEHPAIVDTAVIGVPDDTWGETVMAFVVLKDGAELELEEMQAFCRDRLAGFKIPHHLQITDEIPRNASGKALKTVLREPHWEGKERRVS